jgi:hypothetical protein
MLPAKALEPLVVDTLTLCEILLQEMGSRTEEYTYYDACVLYSRKKYHA